MALSEAKKILKEKVKEQVKEIENELIQRAKEWKPEKGPFEYQYKGEISQYAEDYFKKQGWSISSFNLAEDGRPKNYVTTFTMYRFEDD